MSTLSEFFHSITNNEILPYQERFGADPFSSTFLVVPTGLGKTQAVIVPWLHAIEQGDAAAPTRLVFMLPRQNLTGQVAKTARDLVSAAGLKDVQVLELMGGSSDNRATIQPDQPTILVGTQDILISRALNRGYARKPFRWPLDFALVNNDCLWVFDEIQLTSDALATSAQLAAFRKRFGVFGRVPCVWMSATADPAWLNTVDFGPFLPELRTIRLDATDLCQDVVQRRLHAHKQLNAAPEECRTPEGCAEFVLAQHGAGERSLVIANTVNRAREIAAALRKRKADPVLLHSRFRPIDRERQVALLRQPPAEGQIVVATQVIEAGIDISAHRLITDVAPWGSLVQRFGRVNRYGELNRAGIWWVDQPLHSKAKAKDREKLFAPYSTVDVEAAASLLQSQASASPADLPEANGPAPWQHVLRRADILDLFDTSPDLSGNEIDVSRFIRSGEERDCYVAWRDWDGDSPPSGMPRIEDRELCPVPIDELRKSSKERPAFVWSFLRREWRPAERWYPGMVAVIHTSQGGYTERDGWTPASKTAVSAFPAEGDGEEAFSEDRSSWVSYLQTLLDHDELVVRAMRSLTGSLALSGLAQFQEDLELAAARHDWGKAHPVMQATLHNAADAAGMELLAKQERGKAARGHRRPYFRHELASALAMIQTGDSDLAAYLTAAHHGRVRASVRTMPGERDEDGRRVIRGIRDGDQLPECVLVADVTLPPVILNLDPTLMGSGEDGRPSWTERVLRLRDRIGPFRLAFLEMLLRMADERASEEGGRMAACTR